MFGFRNPLDFGEDRGEVNEMLIAALSHYGYPFDIAAAGCDEQTDPVNLLQNAPGLIEVLRAAGLVKQGALSESNALSLPELIEGIIRLLVRASAGDATATDQLKAADQVINPGKYDMPTSVIKKLIDSYHTKPALARGYALRRLIGELSWVVKSDGGRDVLNGPVRLVRDPLPRDRAIYDAAASRWSAGVGLRTLAIRVYNDRLRDEGIEEYDERSLKRDLEETQKWEESLPSDCGGPYVQVINRWGEDIHLPIRNYSEGWKARRKKGYDKLS